MQPKKKKSIITSRSLGMEQGLLPGRAKLEEKSCHSVPSKTRVSSGPFPIPGPGTVFGKQMVPLSGEIGSSVSGRMDSVTHRGNSLMRGASVGFSPIYPFCQGFCTVHTYTTLQVLQEVI